MSTVISTSTTISQTTLGTYTWPVIINGGSFSNPVVVTFGSNLTFPDANHFFIFAGQYIILDGNWNVVNVAGVTGGYNGLVDDGNINDFYGNTIIQNIGITVSSGTVLSTSSSWFLRAGNSRNVPSGTLTVQNCYSTGNITDSGGGIIYQNNQVSQNTQIIVQNCYSQGAISGNSAGGIVGIHAGDSGSGDFGSLQIINCYSSGVISGFRAGGMTGYQPGTVTITNTYIANGAGNWNSTTANANLLGTNGSIWNTSVTPYLLTAPAPFVPTPCLLTGTRVKTPRGYVPVEKIKVGDSIISNLNLSVKVIEVGKWECSTHNTDLSSKVYKIPAGKFGAKQDVYLSYYHRILSNNRLEIPVKLNLKEANPSNIVEADGHSFMLYHVRVENGNDNLLVVNGGCVVESWIDIVE